MTFDHRHYIRVFSVSKLICITATPNHLSNFFANNFPVVKKKNTISHTVLIRELKLVFMIKFSGDFLDAIRNNLCFEDSVSLESE